MIEWQIATEAASARSEDRVALLELGQAHVAVVADGAGEAPGGREAAELVISRLDRLRPRVAEAASPSFWERVLSDLDAALLSDGSAGEAAVVLVAACAGRLAGASCGDSGAHLFSDAAFTELTAGQQRRPLLGSGRAVPVGFGSTDFAGTLLVASDGLLSHAPFQGVWEASNIADLEHAVEALLSLPRLPSGRYPDDVSVLVARPR